MKMKVLSLEKEKKNKFSFCFFLAYSYLCSEIWHRSRYKDRNSVWNSS